MIEFLVNTITHPAFTAIVGFLAGHFLTIGRDRRKEFNKAAETFRDAFIPELSAIRTLSFPDTIDTVDPYKLLKNAFDRHRVAYETYRPRVKRSHKRAFDRAWQNYYAYDDTGEDAYEHLIKYSPFYIGTPNKECRELAVANIDKLLEFAQHR